MPFDTLYVIYLVRIMLKGQFTAVYIFPLVLIAGVLFVFVLLCRSGSISFNAGKVLITMKLFGKKIFEAQMGEAKIVEIQIQKNQQTQRENKVIVITLQNGKSIDFFAESEERTNSLLSEVTQTLGV
jgi:hypothetical protein